MPVHEIAEILIEYGDVSVIKSAPCLYWVEYESFEADGNHDEEPTLLVNKKNGKQDVYPIS